MVYSTYTIIELSGHIIDSLTLTKVIDKIQSAGFRYQINDIQIGEKKNDLSYAQISLWSENQASMAELLADLKTYGAYPIADSNIRLEPCPQDGKPPDGAYTRLNPPTEILHQDQWIEVNRQGSDLMIVVDPASRSARLEKSGAVKQGDMVVVGKSGIKILPTLGENVHAQPVAR